MILMESVKTLVSDSNRKYLLEKDFERGEDTKEHKDILNVIDTLTFKTVSNTTLLQLNWNLFESKFGEERRTKSDLDINMLRAMMRTNLADYLVNIPVFESLPQSKLEVVTKLCHYSVERAGTRICTEGEEGDNVFILLSGKVKVEVAASKRMVELFEENLLSSSSELETNSRGCSSSIKNGDLDDERGLSRKSSSRACTNKTRTSRKKMMKRKQKLLKARQHVSREHVKTNCRDPFSRPDILDQEHTVELATLSSGEYFGEMSVFIQLPRQATVTATTNVLMASISNRCFRDLYHTISPDLETSVAKLVREHMLDTLLKSRSPFLEEIDQDLAKSMASVTSLSIIEKGAVVFKQGDKAECFFFVFSGSLSVVKQDEGEERMIGLLYSGDYFGEMALMTGDDKRLATISAIEKTVLLVIAKEDFEQCFQTVPQLIYELRVRMQGEKVDLQSILRYKKSKDTFEEFLSQSNSLHILACYEDTIEYSKIVQKDAEVDGQLNFLTNFKERYTSSTSETHIEFSKLELSILEEEISILQNLKQTSEAGNVETTTKIGKPNQNKLQPFTHKMLRKLESELLISYKQSEAFEKLRKRLRFYDDEEICFLV